MANFPDLTGDGVVTRADVLKGRGVFKRGGKVKKTRKFQDGGETEFESKQGENLGISDDIRARAMDYVSRQQNKLVEEPPGSEEKPKAKPKAAAPKTTTSKPPQEKGLERVGVEDLLPIGKAAAVLGAGYGAARMIGKKILSSRAEKTAAEETAKKTAINAELKALGDKIDKTQATRAANKARRSEEGFSPAEALKARKKAGMKAGGSVRSASSRADGIAIRGKTKA
jgi:hypothetical protein